MLKYILMFLPIFLILTSVNFYQVKNIPPSPKAILAYTFFLLPAIFIANFGINYVFNTGYREIQSIWHLTIYLWTANFISIAVLSYLWFSAVPDWRTLMAAVLVIIAIILIR